MPKLLTSKEIQRSLESLKGWQHRGRFLTKTFRFDEFMDGISFLNRVARVAERQEHHPDVKVRYARVTLALQTHSMGGVTVWDVGLARAIDRIEV
jgi:4a-hydroxytetrahydrobiopterin dehydratase